MKITPEATISSLVFKKLFVWGGGQPPPDPPLARMQCSLSFGALKFAKLSCLFIFLAKALAYNKRSILIYKQKNYLSY